MRNIVQLGYAHTGYHFVTNMLHYESYEQGLEIYGPYEDEDYYFEPCMEHVIDSSIQKSLDKEISSALQPVAITPEIDATMVTFLKKYNKDPKKGVDRALQACQNKLLDVSGPLAKILELALQAKETGGSIHSEVLARWVPTV
ncbi:hypothetical protein NDU88_002096 [Pleurodeles waltl]|uniref:Uncharacterized protein n=1 Tax=Pleurodeles waltl TaxID=8319 RepID=A0AAV7QBP3_PLEWA|nr:hypothetical protein NDU88_002096 [Pleurodeles waltl]